MLDLNNSFVDLGSDYNTFRLNIVSYLKNEDREFFLLKKCRAESIGQYPFLHESKSNPLAPTI